MFGRLVGIALVVAVATAGWFVLGGTIAFRTQASDESQRRQLAALWGSAQEQSPPSVAVAVTRPDRKGHPIRTETSLEAASTRIDVDLALDQRRKGLLWYNTYAVRFGARYRLDPATSDGQLVVRFPFPSESATYDDFSLTVDGRRIPATNDRGVITVSVPVRRNQTTNVGVGYRSHGIGTWTYHFGDGIVAVRDLALVMSTNFKAIDFPPQTLAPTEEQQTPAGWKLTWRYREMVGGFGIGMAFPQRLQPGPLASRITFWAPLSLVFYVFVMLVITTLRRIDLHPINYLFLAGAFFAFHLLFAYTVDRIPLGYAFVVCSAVSMFLTVSYLRLVVGLRFAAIEAALAQFFYLILFSYALFDEGFSGLSITIGAIVTLFVTMQVTGRINWSERFAGASRKSAVSAG